VSNKALRCKVHIQNKGWSEWVQEGRLVGTVGEFLRLEAVILEGVDEYRVHVQDLGWSEWVKEGEVAGTEGKGLRIEAIEIKGDNVNYQVHVENFGWLDWARDGETAGTVGCGLRVEAIRIVRSAEPFSVDDSRSHFEQAPAPIVIPDPVQPVHGNKQGKVYIAPGHGTQTNGVWDSGCVDGEYTEAELMLNVARVAVEMLRKWGVIVVSEADSGNDKNMVYSVDSANEAGVDVYVSLHCDYNLAPSGTLPIIYPGSEEGARLANCINSSVMALMGLGSRGVMQRDDYEVSYTDMPACIFELGSISRDILKLVDSRSFGIAIAQGIYDYL